MKHPLETKDYYAVVFNDGNFRRFGSSRVMPGLYQSEGVARNVPYYAKAQTGGRVVRVRIIIEEEMGML